MNPTTQWLTEAQAAMDAGNLESAESLCRRALDNCPGDAAALEKLGDVLALAKRWPESVTALKKAIEVLRGTNAAIRLEVAPGELLDKWSILMIKSERIADAGKLRNVRAELELVNGTRDRAILATPVLDRLTQELKAINEQLWDIENAIRDCERRQDFGPGFIKLARAVYQTNDRRAEVKSQINDLLGAAFKEEKDYHGPGAAD